MREIKYRAWDKVSEQIRRVSMMDFPEWSVSTIELDMNDEIHDYYDTERNSFKNEETDRFILMQYTGLKDKNGVEIYEGDIIKEVFGRDNELYFAYEIKFGEYNNGESYEDAVRGCGFYAQRKETQLNDLSDVSDFEVIGNIYEHKNLLK